MKDRIRKVMESMHMTQQVFADFIGLAPATLSGIFNDRTRPTLNVVEAIKKKIPDISTDWLMFGNEPMYVSASLPDDGNQPQTSAPNTVRQEMRDNTSTGEPMLDLFQVSSQPARNTVAPTFQKNGVRNTQPEIIREEIKYIDKPQRKVTEIRVYYDDQTWESFVPSKK